MNSDEHLEMLRRDGAAFAAAARAGVLAAPVAACPGWTLADLIYHLGEVHDFWGSVVELGSTDRPDLDATPRPPDDDLRDWYEAGLERLDHLLTAADPVAEVWTWSSEKNVAFIRRRMAQETAVHRWDAQQAASGAPGPIDHTLALDGVDEFFDFMLPQWAYDNAAPVGGTVHLHATDGEGEWLVRPEGEGFVVSHGHEKGDAAVRGSASDLLLALWRRVPLDDLDVFGDRDIAARLLAVTDNE